MYRIEFKKRNKEKDKTAKGSYKYINRSELSNKDVIKSTDIEYSYSNVPKLFENNKDKFWGTIDKEERKNGRLNAEILISIPREINKEERTNLIDEFIKNTLDKNTPFSYAIHNPKASDGLPNPHCHLMIYEKTFNRSFFKKEFENIIDKDYFKGTFKKSENYVKKNLTYEKKSFIYDIREKYEEQLLLFSKSHTRDLILDSVENKEKTKGYNELTYNNYLETEQNISINKKGEFMKNFRKILKENKDYIENLKNFTDNLDEENFKKLIKIFPIESEVFKEFRKLKAEELKKQGYDENKIKEKLEKLTSLDMIQETETLISDDSDLLKLDKKIEKELDKDLIVDRYIFSEITSQVFKNDNFNLEYPKYNELNNFFKKLKKEITFNYENYIINSELENKNGDIDDRNVNVKILDKEKYELDCIKFEQEFDKKENEFMKNHNLRKELRGFYYEFLTLEENQTSISFTDFYDNLKTNISNEYKEITKDFVYSKLFYHKENNYFSQASDENINTNSVERFIDKNKGNETFNLNKDYDFLSDKSKKKYLHNIEFFPNLDNNINYNLKELIKNKIGVSGIDTSNIEKTELRLEYVNKIKTIFQKNISYLNQNNNILKSNIYHQAMNDRENILKKLHNGNKNIDFKVTFSKKNDIKTITFAEFIKNIKDKDSESIFKKLNGTLIERGKFNKDEDDINKIKIISNLRPNLPLLKVKKYVVNDYNYGNMKNLKTESKEELLNVGFQKEDFFSYRKKENIYKNPSLLEMAYNHSNKIAETVDLNKDIKHIIVLSMDISKENKLVLSNVKLEKIKKNNLVDLEKINKEAKEKPLKISKSIANKIYDKKFFYDELSKEYKIKENINKKVKDKEKLSYFSYTDDINKMNKTLKSIIKSKENKKYNKNRSVNNQDVEIVLNFNSLGKENKEPNLKIIDNLYNLESIGSDKLSKIFDNNLSNDNFDKIFKTLITEKEFKRENNTVKRIIGFKNYILAEDMEKETSNVSYFKEKKMEILSFQMAITTENLTPENSNVGFLSSINNLSKSVLNKTKNVLSSKKDEETKVNLIDDISNFNKKNLEKLSKKSEIKDNFYHTISKENISNVLKEKQMIRLVVEWDYKQENKEKQEEQKSAIIIDSDDLIKINKDIIFADRKMEKTKLFFKLYIVDETSERIVNLNNYNDNLDENDENLEEKIKEKIVADYFEEEGFQSPKREEKWTDIDREKILSRFNDNYIRELTKKNLTEDNSLENTIKRYVAISDNFKNLFYSLDNNVNIHTSLNSISQTSLGANFVAKIQNYIIKEDEFLKENYKYRNEKILDYLEVEELIDDELSLKRQTKELDFFVENQNTIIESYNLKFELDKDGNVADKKEFGRFNFGFNIKPNNKKLDKNTEFSQNNNKIDTEIESLPIISREIKKKNMIIKKNNSEYLEMLKEIEISL